MNSTAINNYPEVNEKLETIPMMTNEERKEAIDFGTGENLIRQILDDYEAVGLVGENHNKLLCYLASVSRKMPVPLNILALSSSGAGKSTLQDKTLKFVPDEDVVRVSSLTDKALFYKDRFALKHKLLALEEAAGMKDTYSIRTLISEGYLSIARVSGTETIEKQVEGPVSCFQTTTNPEINAETKSRFWVIGIDESREQTRNILELQRYQQTLEGMIDRVRTEHVQNKHKNFQRLLKKCKVVNPYANELFYGDDRLQARRDQPKFLNLCNAVAFLRQMTKEFKFYQDDKIEFEYIEVDREDIRIATELATEILGTSLDDLSIPARDLLAQLDSMTPENEKRTTYTFTRTEIMNFTGWTKTRLHIHLKELIDLELVVKESGKKNCLQHYKLLYQGETERKFLIGLRFS